MWRNKYLKGKIILLKNNSLFVNCTRSIFQRALLSGKGSTSNTSKMTADNHLLFIALINESSDIMLLLPILINTLCLSTTQFEEKLY